MNIKFEDVVAVMPNAVAVADEFIPFFDEYFPTFGLTTSSRVAMFMAQIAHESGELKRLEENLNYSVVGLMKTFPKYFTSTLAPMYAKQPQKIANRVYAERMGNGLEDSGDGWRYRGRGLIQITGRNNYKACGEDIKMDLLRKPDLLSEPRYAVLSALWYWSKHRLNSYADANDLRGCTKAINGGLNGLDDREKYFHRAEQVKWLGN